MRTEAQNRTGVGIVILNHNGKQLTVKCLESVINSLYPTKDILVVDNASTDGSVEYLGALFPQVLIIENPENLGVAGGRLRVLEGHAVRYRVPKDRKVAFADAV